MSELEADLKRAAMHALRHYVTFSYYARHPKDAEMAQVCCCSAFVLRVRDIWCLVTAGHVIDGIEDEQRKGFELVSFRIWDGWSEHAAHHQHVPFDYLSLPKFRLTKEGMDYGLIALNSLTAQNLAVNVTPIGEESYEKEWPQSFDGYAMIGTPGTTVSMKRVGPHDVSLTQSVCIIPVERVDEPPDALVQPFPRFYGQILMPEDWPGWTGIGRDIEGMSGGPIIGIRRNEEGVRYWIVGVQSGWLRSSRIIAACYLQHFARVVGQCLDDADEDSSPPKNTP
jgi:hypothetical protein